FGYGDPPETGKRPDALSVSSMMAEAREFAGRAGAACRVGVSCLLGHLPQWKQPADSLYVQVSYSVEDLVAWREQLRFDGAVYPGVMVLPSASMARKLSAGVPQLGVPPAVMARL